MPGKHAKLSPSSAERWISCPASVALSATMPKQASSSYAEEGTAAHGLAEIKCRLEFGEIDRKQFNRRRAQWTKEFEQYAEDPEVLAEMEEHTDAYVVLVKERVALYPNSAVMFEQRVDTGVPSSWGTSDTVIVSPIHVEVIDFKYGQGVPVEAHGNPQLRLYGCGALDEFGDILGETELVRITVHQPRLDHILTEELTADALREWRSVVAIPAAEEALGDDAHFGPSEDACRWCPASGQCRAQIEAVFADDFEAKPALLEPEEMAEALGRVPLIREWLKAFEEAALKKAYSEGVPLPGYKVVLSGGQRSVKDHDRAIDTLVEAGYDQDEIANVKAKGIGDLEKLLGKDKFKALLEDTGIVQKGDGKPALVLESDKRVAIAPDGEAAKVFAEADGEDLL